MHSIVHCICHEQYDATLHTKLGSESLEVRVEYYIFTCMPNLETKLSAGSLEVQVEFYIFMHAKLRGKLDFQYITIFYGFLLSPPIYIQEAPPPYDGHYPAQPQPQPGYPGYPTQQGYPLQETASYPAKEAQQPGYPPQEGYPPQQ